MKFPVIAIYANAYVFLLVLHSFPFTETSLSLFSVDDHTVPYVTAAIEEHDPFIQRKLTGLEMYVPTYSDPAALV